MQGAAGLHVRLWFVCQDQDEDNSPGYRGERMENPTPLFPRVPQLFAKLLDQETKGQPGAPVTSEQQLRTARIWEELSSLDMRNELWCSFCDLKREKCALPFRCFLLSKKG